MTGIVCDTKAMRALTLDLRAVSVDAEKEFYAGLVEGGEIVAAKARENAAALPGANRTTRIADSVVVRRRATRVRIEAGGDAAPEAAPLEHHGMPGEFRHPLFGNTGEWFTQPAEPFLTPAAIESEPAVIAHVNNKIARAFNRLGGLH